jgi:starch phosphorylase
MKLPPNGGLNLSVLDGWWPESYNGKNGWAIGADLPNDPIKHPANSLQDQVDISSLFTVLENQIVPLYYAKPDGRLPLAWIQLMRESIRTIVPIFNTHRMVSEYSRRLYEPAAACSKRLKADDFKNARALSAWKNSMRDLWPAVKVMDYKVRSSNDGQNEFLVGQTVTVEAHIHLGSIKPENVRVQAYFGPVSQGLITSATVQDLTDLDDEGSGKYIYKGEIPTSDSGAFGINIRVIPNHPDLVQDHELRLITWAR